MTILVAIAVGIVFGVIVAALFRRGLDYMAVDVLLGICGAIVGMGVDYVAQPGWSFGIITFSGTLAAALGAGVVLLIYQLILQTNKKKHKSVARPGHPEE